MKLVIASFIAGLMLIDRAGAQSVAGLFNARMSVQDAVFSFYSEPEPTPSVVVRVGRIHTDYERKWFFRIGLLPIGVLEDVRLEVRHPETVINGLAQMHQWLGAQGARRLELRRVSVEADTSSVTNRVEAGRAKILPNGRWALSDGVRFDSGTNEVRIASAALQMTGPRAGQLVWDNLISHTNNLFTQFKL